MTLGLTVVLASYDRRLMLEEAITSALAQADSAVLVVDDGSGEETRTYLTSLAAKEPRVRVVFQDHRGVGAARARGVLEATTELICILDSDDRLEPGAIARLRSELVAHPELDLVYGGIRELRRDGTASIRRYRRFSTSGAMIIATLASPRVPFKHSGMTFRRSVALELGSYDASLPSKIDIDFVLKFLRAGKRVRPLSGDPVVTFRVHAGSMSRKRRAGIPVWFALIDKYGPENAAARVALKTVRAASELLKELYVAVRRV